MNELDRILGEIDNLNNTGVLHLLFDKMNNIKLLPSLLIFANVANKGSFTQAAKHLGMSKSAVSQQVSRLEDALGSQLLSRNTRGLSVTALGQKTP